MARYGPGVSYSLSVERADFAIPVAKTSSVMKIVAPLYEDVFCGVTADALDEAFSDLAWPLVRKNEHWVMKPDEPRNLGWQGELFKRLAPFVVDGSYVTARGEDGRRMGWYFSGGRCFDEVDAEIELGAVRLVVPVSELQAAMRRVRDKLPKLVAKLGDPVSITAVFAALHWTTSRAKDGSLQLGRKQDDHPLTRTDERVLHAIAPFVGKGSYVEAGNGDDTWRFVFDGGRCTRLYDER